MPEKRLTIPETTARKGSTPIVALTCYTAYMARLLDEVCDVLLVGDSLGMVVYGMESTLPVTMELMLAHTKAVVAASHKALVVADMPFGSYQQSKEQAFANAARLMAEGGAGAVKLEGGAEMAETVSFLTERAIPVIAHIGLMPQHVHRMGGYKKQGKTVADQKLILKAAKAHEAAGAFALLIEGTESALAKKITAAVKIPTIGIGAGKDCDGQVLVTEDVLGLSGFAPGFVKPYATLGEAVKKATAQFAADVRKGKYPV